MVTLGHELFFVDRSDEVFTNGSGVVHPANCLTGSDVALFSGHNQQRRHQWSDVDRVELRFRGHKGDQAQVGSVVLRTRSEVRGPCSELSTTVMPCSAT